ncbi:MAG: outer rane biosis protein [Planctomycetaceae bacterium]|nr:outer rane biosis protein [Planctomycetaceae bacterium]
MTLEPFLMSKCWRLIGLTGVVLCLLSVCARAGDWPHWRGPNRDDRVDEDSGWDARAWPLRDPAWKANVGAGGSSPLVAGGRVYALGWKDGQDIVVCLDVSTGHSLWSRSYTCPEHARHAMGDESLYSGPTSTPEYDAETGFLYTLSCDGDLHCWNTRDQGRKVWGINLYQQYAVPRRPKFGRSSQRDYGYTTAPLLSGDWIIVEVGDDEGNLMAFSRRTGERAWVSEFKGPAGHTGGIVPLQIEGVSCVAVLTYEGLHVARLDPPNVGRTVALYPWGTEYANNVATPVVHGNDVLITAAYNHVAICKLHLTLEGATKVWEQPFASKICSPIIDRGRIYWTWQKLHCLDLETGKQLWEGGEFGDAGSCIKTSDDRLIVWGYHGRLALVETAVRAPVKYQELARLDRVFSADVWPHVVLANGQLLCKDRQGNVKCFYLRPSDSVKK